LSDDAHRQLGQSLIGRRPVRTLPGDDLAAVASEVVALRGRSHKGQPASQHSSTATIRAHRMRRPPTFPSAAGSPKTALAHSCDVLLQWQRMGRDRRWALKLEVWESPSEKRSPGAHGVILTLQNKTSQRFLRLIVAFVPFVHQDQAPPLLSALLAPCATRNQKVCLKSQNLYYVDSARTSNADRGARASDDHGEGSRRWSRFCFVCASTTILGSICGDW